MNSEKGLWAIAVAGVFFLLFPADVVAVVFHVIGIRPMVVLPFLSEQPSIYYPCASLLLTFACLMRLPASKKKLVGQSTILFVPYVIITLMYMEDELVDYAVYETVIPSIVNSFRSPLLKSFIEWLLSWGYVVVGGVIFVWTLPKILQHFVESTSDLTEKVRRSGDSEFLQLLGALLLHGTAIQFNAHLMGVPYAVLCGAGLVSIALYARSKLVARFCPKLTQSR